MENKEPMDKEKGTHPPIPFEQVVLNLMNAMLSNNAALGKTCQVMSKLANSEYFSPEHFQERVAILNELYSGYFTGDLPLKKLLEVIVDMIIADTECLSAISDI